MDHRRWEKWVAASDEHRLRWAINYLTEKAHLESAVWYIFETRDLVTLQAEFLRWVNAHANQLSGKEWVSRISSAWRQAKYRERIFRRNKKISAYSISGKAKKTLAILAKKRGKTVHETLEALILEAGTRRERQDSLTDQFHQIGEANRARLEGAAPAPYQPHSYPPSPLLPSAGRYPEEPEGSSEF